MKNAWRVRASAVIARPERQVEPFSDELHQLGDGGQVPVGIRRGNVAKVGGQLWHRRVDVDPPIDAIG